MFFDHGCRDIHQQRHILRRLSIGHPFQRLSLPLRNFALSRRLGQQDDAQMHHMRHRHNRIPMCGKNLVHLRMADARICDQAQRPLRTGTVSGKTDGKAGLDAHGGIDLYRFTFFWRQKTGVVGFLDPTPCARPDIGDSPAVNGCAGEKAFVEIALRVVGPACGQKDCIGRVTHPVASQETGKAIIGTGKPKIAIETGCKGPDIGDGAPFGDPAQKRQNVRHMTPLLSRKDRPAGLVSRLFGCSNLHRPKGQRIVSRWGKVMQVDVVVVGGAVMGASCAYWLTAMRPGLSVLVVEQDPSFARASTALSVASIRQQFTTAVNVQISRFGIEFIRHFKDRMGLHLGLKENGYLFLSQTEEGARTLADVARMQQAEGAATEVWSPDQIAARFPWLYVADLTAGSFGPRDEGWFDNMGLLSGFRSMARQQGATFVTDRVTGLAVTGGKVTGVMLEKTGQVTCGAAINAAGTRAAEVCRMAGLDLQVEPRKRTVFVIDAPNARHPDAPLLVDHGFYLRPEQGHWITATVPQDDGPCAPDDFEPDLHLFEEVIWEQLYHRAPGFDAVKVVRHWVGHYAYNRLDQNAILGPHPDLPNLYLCNGFSGHGLQQSPAVGRGIAEHLLTGAWQTINLSDLSVTRMVENKPFREMAIV